MIRPLIATAFLLVIAGCTSVAPPADLPKDGTQLASFTRDVKPIFERRCVRCHNKYQTPAGLNLQDREAVFSARRTGTNKPFLVPGHPEHSLIYHALTRPADHPAMMPGDGWGLSASQEKNVHAWITQGANWPEGRRGRLKEKSLRVEFDGDL